MSPNDLKSAFILLTILAIFLAKKVTSQLPTKPTLVYVDCDIEYSGEYTRNSPYHRNLNLVLPALASHASDTPFYNSSVGLKNGPDTAYAQYYCRGDISTQLCNDSVKAATKVVSEGSDCFGVRAGNVWYEECTLRYDNKSNVGFWDSSLSPDWTISDENVSDPTTFEQVVGTLMETLIKKAAYGGDPKEFATGEANVTKYETVYCLVQCSPDITGLICESCLKANLRYWAKTYAGNDPEGLFLFYMNCQMRYGLAPFYLSTSDAAPTPVGSSSLTPSSPGRIPSPVDASLSGYSGKDAKYYVTRIVVPVIFGAILVTCSVSFGIWFCLSRSMIKNAPPNSSWVQDQTPRDVPSEEYEIGSVECFSFAAIDDATNKFSDDNKLGEGGFGIVYKGMRQNGQPIAIKRLSKHASGQGIKEFKTEVAVVAKLQHRNLVRLLGFCDEHEEQILVYEYLPNLSLDKFLLDTSMSAKLDWKARAKIIEGVAWGLRYLHIDSLLTIVHRDLKPSNILLDKEMNPKIADFGMAKLVRIDETAGNTSRIVGTYGYMAPEYAMKGRFSTKSDIYSFGVIILEILSGKSSNHFYDSDSGHGLLHHAWRIWSDKAIEKLVDPTLQDNYSKTEAERCLQIGLLCVQDDAVRRPTIRVVVSMLENPFFELPSPSVPSSFHSALTSIISTTSEDGETQSSRAGFENSSSTSVDINDH